MSKEAAKKQASPVSGIIKDTLIIFAITLVAGGVLGFVYELTKAPIERQRLEKQAAACAEVFKEADAEGNLKDVESLTFTETAVNRKNAETVRTETEINADITEIYEAKKADGTLYGYVIAVETKEGYGGNIRLYMGMTMDGTVKGISILEIHETPGLGMRASEVLVPQFRDVSAPEFTVTKKGAKSDSEIDAITSATITSKAVTRGVNFGKKYFEESAKGGSES